MADFKDYDVWKDIWPDAAAGAAIAPVGTGMDRHTGKILSGWPHVVQSIHLLFVTRYHERIIRQWVGSFVPHLLGEQGTDAVITRFFWAIATAIELWEPRYSIQRIIPYPPLAGGHDPGDYVSAYRRGEFRFKLEGIYMPRGHLGDKTPENRRAVGLHRGPPTGRWETWAP